MADLDEKTTITQQKRDFWEAELRRLREKVVRVERRIDELRHREIDELRHRERAEHER